MPLDAAPAAPTPAEQLYGCDCCNTMVTRDQIAVVTAYGIETAACCTCRGFPGFTSEQIRLGLTVPAAVLTEAEIEAAVQRCPVFRTIANGAK